MRSTRAWVVTLWALAPAPALAQPALDSLWPNANGLRWDYEITIEDVLQPDSSFTTDARMTLAGTVETAGGTAQVLQASHAVPQLDTAPALDPILRAVWRARPDLRTAIEARYAGVQGAAAVWWPLLLHDGYFMKTEASIQMWQPDWDHPTWTYLTSDLRVGATFTHQLIPELADDVFLHGAVEAVDATVSTLAGTFTNAVRMRYLIDYGWSECVDSEGNPLGRSRAETRGHVHYVPDVGPVDLLEDFIPNVESEGACMLPPPGLSIQTISMSLKRGPVGVASTSWTGVKRLYH